MCGCLNRVNVRQLTTEQVGLFKPRRTAVPYGSAKASLSASIGLVLSIFAETATLQFITFSSLKLNTSLV